MMLAYPPFVPCNDDVNNDTFFFFFFYVNSASFLSGGFDVEELTAQHLFSALAPST
jgi:hypothetical protein